MDETSNGLVKLNTDGALLGNLGKAGGGGVIRDSSGKWVKGFSRSIGVATSVMAECWAIRDGLTLANQLGIQNLEVKLDAKTIVDLLQSNTVSNKPFSALLNDCRSLLKAFIRSECNMCLERQISISTPWLGGDYLNIRILRFLIPLHLVI